MKVLYISHAMTNAAYRRKLEELGKHKSLEVTLLVPTTYRNNTFEDSDNSNYKLILSPLRGALTNHLFFFPDIKSILLREKPDLIHLDEEPFNLVSYFVARHAKKLGIPLLFSTWQNLFKHYPFPFNFIEKTLFATAIGATAGTPEAQRILLRRGFDKPIIILPQCGIDITSSHRKRSSPFTLGYVGRIVPEKGLDVLIEACRRLPQPWRLILVGDGSYLSTLRKKVQKYNLERQVSFIGFVPSKNIGHYYQKFDLLVLPSLTTVSWKEQFGRVLIEAMAHGVPVIGSTSGAIPSVIGNAGLLFEEGSVMDLKRQINTYMNYESKRQSYIQKGIQHVKKHYTNQIIAQKTYLFYKHLLNHENSNTSRLP